MAVSAPVLIPESSKYLWHSPEADDFKHYCRHRASGWARSRPLVLSISANYTSHCRPPSPVASRVMKTERVSANQRPKVLINVRRQRHSAVRGRLAGIRAMPTLTRAFLDRQCPEGRPRSRTACRRGRMGMCERDKRVNAALKPHVNNSYHIWVILPSIIPSYQVYNGCEPSRGPRRFSTETRNSRRAKPAARSQRRLHKPVSDPGDAGASGRSGLRRNSVPPKATVVFGARRPLAPLENSCARLPRAACSGD